jgi:hypothetical protein
MPQEPTEVPATTVAEQPAADGEDEGAAASPDGEIVNQIEQELQPQGLRSILPFLMSGLGMVTIIGGFIYFVSSAPPREKKKHKRKKKKKSDPAADTPEPAAKTREHERPEIRTATGILMPKAQDDEGDPIEGEEDEWEEDAPLESDEGDEPDGDEREG